METVTTASRSDDPAKKRRVARPSRIGHPPQSNPDPALAEFEKELGNRLGRTPQGSPGRVPDSFPTPMSRSDINAWIVSHPYIARCARMLASKAAWGPALAEEVAQDALSRLWENLNADPRIVSQWDGCPGGYWPWLVSCRVADSLKEALRTRKVLGGMVRSYTFDDEALGVCEPEPTPTEARENEKDREKLISQVRLAYLALPPILLLAVKKVLIEGQSFHAAKTDLGVRCHKTAKQRYLRALELMYRAVGQSH